MTEEQQPRVHPQDPAEGADAGQRATENEPQARPQEPAEGPDDDAAANEGDA
jgi:hypothetical protein